MRSCTGQTLAACPPHSPLPNPHPSVSSSSRAALLPRCLPVVAAIAVAADLLLLRSFLNSLRSRWRPLGSNGDGEVISCHPQHRVCLRRPINLLPRPAACLLLPRAASDVTSSSPRALEVAIAIIGPASFYLRWRAHRRPSKPVVSRYAISSAFSYLCSSPKPPRYAGRGSTVEGTWPWSNARPCMNMKEMLRRLDCLKQKRDLPIANPVNIR